MPSSAARWDRLATAAFAVAVAIAAAFLLHYLADLTFWRDEWGFILDRRGSDLNTYMTPFVEQLLAVAVLVYKVLLDLFGLGSPVPFQIVHTVVLMATVVVVYVYVRRRVGPWLALAGTLPLLFFGPSWDDVLFPFQLSIIGAVGCGVGALLALDGQTRRGDITAAALLVIGLFSQDAAIPFVAAATVDILLRPGRWRRLYVVAIPTLLWLLWYAGWGRDAQNFVSVHNFATLPGYVADGLSSSLASLVGLAVPRTDLVTDPLVWGRPLLVVAIGFGVWRIVRGGLSAMPTRLWAVLVAQLGFWSLTGLNAAFFGQATSGRYQIIGAILWVMIAAELLRGVRVSRLATAVVLAVALLSAVVNFSLLRDTAHGLSIIAEQEKGGLAALELTRGVVDDSFTLTEENSGVDYLGIVDAGSYFSAIDAFGSPAYTPEELAKASEPARVAADKLFGAALGLKAIPAQDAGACTPRTVFGTAPAVVSAVSQPLVITAQDGPLALSLRRYARESFPVSLGSVGGGRTVRVDIPADRSSVRWQLQLKGKGAFAVCGGAR